jgi:hypothetical protein
MAFLLVHSILKKWQKTMVIPASFLSFSWLSRIKLHMSYLLLVCTWVWRKWRIRTASCQLILNIGTPSPHWFSVPNPISISSSLANLILCMSFLSVNSKSHVNSYCIASLIWRPVRFICQVFFKISTRRTPSLFTVQSRISDPIASLVPISSHSKQIIQSPIANSMSYY